MHRLSIWEAYRSGDTTLAVDVETGPTFKGEIPKILFQGTYASTAISKIAMTSWDIHPNGKKFLMIKLPQATGTAPNATAPQPKIIVVVNWTEELKQLVPGK